MSKVKICGLTTLDDARLACELGADYLGFVMWPGSKRHVAPETVRAIVSALPRDRALTVGVFVNAPAATVVAVMTECGLDLAQLHGDETPATAVAIGSERVWKAFCLRTPRDIEAAAAYPAAAVVADAALPGMPGGTGTLADWALAARLARLRPLVLAGGLRAENVAAAIQAVAPHAVDVAGGTEAAAGKKDPARLRAFLAAAVGCRASGVA